MAIVPDDTPQEVVDALEQQGLNVTTYKAGDDADRMRVVREQASEETRFSVEEGKEAELGEEDKGTTTRKGWLKSLPLEKLEGKEPVVVEKPVIVDAEKYKNPNKRIRGKELEEYRKKALKYATDNNLYGTYINESNGRTEIKFDKTGKGETNGGLKELLYKATKPVEIEAALAVPELIKNGVYIESADNRKKDEKPNILKYHYYICGLNVGGEDYVVHMNIAEDKDGNRYYDHQVVRQKKSEPTNELTHTSSPEISSNILESGAANNDLANRGEVSSVAPTSNGKGNNTFENSKKNGENNSMEARRRRAGERAVEALKKRGVDVVVDADEMEKTLNEAQGNVQKLFTGEKGARTYDSRDLFGNRISDLNVAKTMEQQGKDAINIKMATGWEKGVDGKWRYETPDYTVKRGFFNQEYTPELRQRKTPLGDVLENAEELFAAYPELRDVKVIIKRLSGAVGAYNSLNKEIFLNSAFAAKPLSEHERTKIAWRINTRNHINDTLVHKIQHAIQYIEGFAEGGISSMQRREKGMTPAERKGLWNRMDEIDGRLEKILSERKNSTDTSAEDYTSLYNEESDLREERERIGKRLADDSRRERKDIYHELAGEVEARNVAARRKMPMDERRRLLASVTEDVDRKDQMILQNGLLYGTDGTEYELVNEPRYLKTPDGEIYGFTYKGKVYLDPSVLDANTPVHEYTHIFDEALQKDNPTLWKQGIELLKRTPLWEQVKNMEQYKDIANDEDRLASEVHSRLAGAEGQKYFEQLQAEIDRTEGALDKAEKIDFLHRLRDWLDKAMRWVKDKVFGKGDMSLDEFVEMPLSDLLDDGVVREQASEETRFSVDEGEETRRGKYQYFTGSIKDLVAKAREGALGKVKKLISSASSKLVKDLLDKGVRINENYKHIVADSEIRHTFAHHGDERERLRGQIPITEEDFEKIPDIVENYDTVEYEGKERDNDVIRYSKAYDDGTVIYLEEVRNGRGELALKTLWKTKRSSKRLGANRTNATQIPSSDETSTDKGSNISETTKGNGEKDTRFSIDDKAEEQIGEKGIDIGNGLRMSVSENKEDNTLYVSHSLSRDNLWKVVRAGCLVNPSLAVCDITQRIHSDFGDVRLFFRPNILIGQDTYAGDAWTVRYPYTYTRGRGSNRHTYIAGTKDIATPENISKWMNEKQANDPYWIATILPRMHTLDEIRGAKGRLRKDRKDRDAFTNKMIGLAWRTLDEIQRQDPLMKIYPPHWLDEFKETLPNSDPAAALERKYNVIFPAELADELREARRAFIEDRPTPYFETKMNRVVPLNEIAAVVTEYPLRGIIDGQLKDALEAAGAKVYDRIPEDEVRSYVERVLDSESLRFSIDESKEVELGEEKDEGKTAHKGWLKSLPLEKLEGKEPVVVEKPVIVSDEEYADIDKFLSYDALKTLKAKAKSYARQNKLYGDYVNKNTKRSIQYESGRQAGNGGLSEILYGARTAADIESTAVIPDIIKNAVYFRSEENHKKDKHPDIVNFHYYLCGLKIGGEDYVVCFDVAEEKDGSRYYNQHLVLQKNGESLIEPTDTTSSPEPRYSSHNKVGSNDPRTAVGGETFSSAPVSNDKGSNTSETAKGNEEKDIRFSIDEKASDLSKGLGIDIDTTERGRNDRDKYVIDPQTGKISIVLGNHNSVEDVERMVLTSMVQLHSLRDLFGDRYDTFLYENSSPL